MGVVLHTHFGADSRTGQHPLYQLLFLTIFSKSASVISSNALRISHLSISVSLMDFFVAMVAFTACFSTFRHVSSSMCE